MTKGDTMWKRERRILVAAQRVGEDCGEALASVAGSFTCTEAEAIVTLLDLFNSVFAPDFRRIHAEGDDDDSDRHRDGWKPVDAPAVDTPAPVLMSPGDREDVQLAVDFYVDELNYLLTLPDYDETDKRRMRDLQKRLIAMPRLTDGGQS